MLQAGDEAPDFSLESDEGETVTLSALRGRPVVFFSIPRTTPRAVRPRRAPCATATTRSRRSAPRSMASRQDDSESHRSFRAKFGLPFPLLVDTGHAVADLYDVWRERPNGKMGVLRSAFVVGADGRLVRASYGVKPEDTTPEALAALLA